MNIACRELREMVGRGKSQTIAPPGQQKAKRTCNTHFVKNWGVGGHFDVVVGRIRRSAGKFRGNGFLFFRLRKLHVRT